jgi:hypothetical protein
MIWKYDYALIQMLVVSQFDMRASLPDDYPTIALKQSQNLAALHHINFSKVNNNLPNSK